MIPLLRYRELILLEKKFYDNIRAEEVLINQKLKEKNIEKLLNLIQKQSFLDEQELNNLTREIIKEEEVMKDIEVEIKGSKHKSKISLEKELNKEQKHLALIYIIIPLLKQKNLNLLEQKQILENRHPKKDIRHLRELIHEELSILERINHYEAKANILLERIEREVGTIS